MNKFYKYEVADGKFALTEQEHNQIVRMIEQKETGLVLLRKGSLVINLSFIRSISEILYKSELENFAIPEEYLPKKLN